MMRAYGLPVPLAHPLQLEDVKVLAVERFDRARVRSGEEEPWIIWLIETVMWLISLKPHDPSIFHQRCLSRWIEGLDMSV